MPKTLLSIRTDVRNTLDESSAALWSDAELNVLINEALRDIARRAEVLQVKSTAVTITAGTQDYSMPADVIRVHKVEFVPTGSTQIYPVRHSTLMEMDPVWGINQSQQSSYPSFYVLWGYPGSMTMRLFPVPAQGGALNLYYYRLPATASADVDNLDIPEGWWDIVTMYAVYRAKLKDRDPTWQDTKVLYEERLQDLVDRSRIWHDQARMITTGVSWVPQWLYEFQD